MGVRFPPGAHVTKKRYAGLAQLVERPVYTGMVVGSSPTACTLRLASLAQCKHERRGEVPRACRGALEKDMNWYVYIAEAGSGYYYVGISPNPKERINRHNRGEGSQMARQHGTFRLRYSSAAFSNKSEARKREVQLKGWSRSKKEKLINKEWN